MEVEPIELTCLDEIVRAVKTSALEIDKSLGSSVKAVMAIEKSLILYQTGSTHAVFVQFTSSE